MTKNNYAMICIDDVDNSVSIFYGYTANTIDDSLPTNNIFLSDQVSASIDKGQKIFRQEDAEFNDFMNDIIEIRDPNEVAVEKLQELVNIDWNHQYGRKPNSIAAIENILNSGLSDLKKVNRVVKEMNKTWSKGVQSYYTAFRDGYKTSNYDSFDEKISDLNLVRNEDYEHYNQL